MGLLVVKERMSGFKSTMFPQNFMYVKSDWIIGALHLTVTHPLMNSVGVAWLEVTRSMTRNGLLLPLNLLSRSL